MKKALDFLKKPHQSHFYLVKGDDMLYVTQIRYLIMKMQPEVKRTLCRPAHLDDWKKLLAQASTTDLFGTTRFFEVQIALPFNKAWLGFLAEMIAQTQTTWLIVFKSFNINYVKSIEQLGVDIIELPDLKKTADAKSFSKWLLTQTKLQFLPEAQEMLNTQLKSPQRILQLIGYLEAEGQSDPVSEKKLRESAYFATDYVIYDCLDALLTRSPHAYRVLASLQAGDTSLFFLLKLLNDMMDVLVLLKKQSSSKQYLYIFEAFKVFSFKRASYERLVSALKLKHLLALKMELYDLTRRSRQQPEAEIWYDVFRWTGHLIGQDASVFNT